MTSLFFYGVVILARTIVIEGYSSGAPTGACTSMLPVHGTNSPSTAPFPYSLDLSDNVYTSGATITVRLQGTQTFNGFLIKAVSQATNQAVGFIAAPANTKNIVCDAQVTAGLTHSSPLPKTFAQFQWTAPDVSTGNIVFRATVVANYATFWRDQEMATITSNVVVPTVPTSLAPVSTESVSTREVTSSTLNISSTPLSTTTIASTKPSTAVSISSSDSPASYASTASPNPVSAVTIDPPKDSTTMTRTSVSVETKRSTASSESLFTLPTTRIQNTTYSSPVSTEGLPFKISSPTTGPASTIESNKSVTVPITNSVRNSPTLHHATPPNSARFTAAYTDSTSPSMTTIENLGFMSSVDPDRFQSHELTNDEQHSRTHITSTRPSSLVSNVMSHSSISSRSDATSKAAPKVSTDIHFMNSTAHIQPLVLANTNRSALSNKIVFTFSNSRRQNTTSSMITTNSSSYNTTPTYLNTMPSTSPSEFALDSLTTQTTPSLLSESLTKGVPSSTTPAPPVPLVTITEPQALIDSRESKGVLLNRFANDKPLGTQSTFKSPVAARSVTAPTVSSEYSTTNDTSKTGSGFTTEFLSTRSTPIPLPVETNDFTSSTEPLLTVTTDRHTGRTTPSPATTEKQPLTFSFIATNSTTMSTAPSFLPISDTSLTRDTPTPSSVRVTSLEPFKVSSSTTKSTIKSTTPSSESTSDTSITRDTQTPSTLKHTSIEPSLMPPTTASSTLTPERLGFMNNVKPTSGHLDRAITNDQVGNSMQTTIIAPNWVVEKFTEERVPTQETTEPSHSAQEPVPRITSQDDSGTLSSVAATSSILRAITTDTFSPVDATTLRSTPIPDVTEGTAPMSTQSLPGSSELTSTLGSSDQSTTSRSEPETPIITTPGSTAMPTITTLGSTAMPTITTPGSTDTPTITTAGSTDMPITTTARSTDTPITTTARSTDTPITTTARSTDTPITTTARSTDTPITTTARSTDAPITTTARSTDAPITTTARSTDTPTITTLGSSEKPVPTTQESSEKSTTLASSKKPIITTPGNPEMPIISTPGSLEKSTTLPSSKKPIITTLESTDTPTTSTARKAKDKPILAGKTNSIQYDLECGSSKGCFVQCSGSTCDFMITWRDVGNAVAFEMFGRPSTVDSYIAVGFSSDTRMGEDSVTECVHNSGRVEVFQSYNTPNDNNVRLANPKLGLANEDGAYVNGVLQCSFTRLKKVPGEDQIYDLDRDWHIMYATGIAVTGFTINMHSLDGEGHPKVSGALVDYQSFDVIGSGAKYTLTNSIQYDLECGSSKGCFVQCSGSTCDFMITWRDVGNAVAFEMFGRPSTVDSYIAVGFSSDTRMGEDSVTECVHNSGRVEVFQSYNTPNDNNVRLANPKLGLANEYGAYVNGVLQCSFTRLKKVPGEDEIYDLDRDWHIMYATGIAVTGFTINMHSLDGEGHPKVSGALVDYQSFDVIGSGAKYTLVKAHGCLMIFAWVLFTGVGLVIARYYKGVWADKKFLEQKIWFQIHRSTMVAAVLFNAIAIVIIFVDVEGYSEIPDIPGKSYLKAHPILGIIITVLSITNPIMALFRCGPTDKRRPIFNWAHWAVGMIAYILSAICICFGFQLGKASTPDYAINIMIGYVAYIILFDVLQEVLEFLAKREPKGRVEALEMKGVNGSENGGVANGSSSAAKDKKLQNDKVKTILFAVHIAFTGAFALVLTLVVALN